MVPGYEPAAVTNRVPIKDTEFQNGVALALLGPSPYSRRNRVIRLPAHDESVKNCRLLLVKSHRSVAVRTNQDLIRGSRPVLASPREVY